MFGYVTVNESELKMKDARRYKSFYCGLCRSLKRRCGLRGQAVLPYDMAFVDILLNGLYETPLTEEDRICLVHPARKQHMVYNRITDYTADMGLLFAYYKFLDDAEDEHSLRAQAAARALKKPVGKISAEWPRQAEACRVYIDSLSSFEKKRIYDLDGVAGLSGTALGEIFVMQEDEWSPELRKMGFYLGKFVYLMDAYEDLEKDIKKGRYNPWEPYADNVDFDATAENVLTMMMAECAKQFEKLPIVQDIDILRNIIYSGVWMKYAELKRKKEADDSRSL